MSLFLSMGHKNASHTGCQHRRGAGNTFRINHSKRWAHTDGPQALPLAVLGRDLVVRIPVATYVGQVNSTLANHYRSPHLWIPPDPVCNYDKPQSGAQRESPIQGHHQFLTLFNHHTYTNTSKLTNLNQIYKSCLCGL